MRPGAPFVMSTPQRPGAFVSSTPQQPLQRVISSVTPSQQQVVSRTVSSTPSQIFAQPTQVSPVQTAPAAEPLELNYPHVGPNDLKRYRAVGAIGAPVSAVPSYGPNARVVDSYVPQTFDLGSDDVGFLRKKIRELGEIKAGLQQGITGAARGTADAPEVAEELAAAQRRERIEKTQLELLELSKKMKEEELQYASKAAASNAAPTPASTPAHVAPAPAPAPAPARVQPVDAKRPVLTVSNKSGPSFPVALLVDLLGLPVDIVFDEFSAVPALQDNGLVLTNCNSILRHLVAKYKPNSAWYPADLRARAVIEDALEVITVSLRRPFDTAVNYILSGYQEVGYLDDLLFGFSSGIGAHIPFNGIHPALTRIAQTFLSGSRFIGGAEPSIADLVLYAQVSVMQFSLDLHPHERLVEWVGDMDALLGDNEVRVNFLLEFEKCRCPLPIERSTQDSKPAVPETLKHY